MKKRTITWETLLRTACIFSVGIMLTRYVFMLANVDMKADIAGQIVQMWEMKRTGTLFPSGWVDSSEIHLLAYPMYLISFFVNDGILARNIAMLLFDIILLVLIIALFRYLFRSKGYLIAIPIIFSNMFPGFFARLFFMYGDYLQTIFYTLIAIIAMARAVDDEFCIVSKKWFILFLLNAVWSTFIGFQGWSQVAAPLSGAIIVFMYFRYLKKEYPFHESTGLRVIFTNRLMIFIYCLAAASAVGTILNLTVLEKLINIPGLGGATVFGTITDLIEVPKLIYHGIFDSLLVIREGTSFFSGGGIQVFARVFMIWLLFGFIPLRYMKEHGSTARIEIFRIYTAVSTLEMTLILLLGSSYTYASCIRYYAIPLFFVVMYDSEYLYHHYFENREVHVRILHSAAACLLTLIFAIDLLVPFNYRENYEQAMTESREVTDFLKDHGLTHGYGLYGTSNNLTAYANNTVQIIPVMFAGNKDTLYRRVALSSTDWYEDDYYEGRSFLLIYKDETELFENVHVFDGDILLKEKASEILKCGIYTIWVFDYDLMDDIG